MFCVHIVWSIKQGGTHAIHTHTSLTSYIHCREPHRHTFNNFFDGLRFHRIRFLGNIRLRFSFVSISPSVWPAPSVLLYQGDNELLWFLLRLGTVPTHKQTENVYTTDLTLLAKLTRLYISYRLQQIYYSCIIKLLLKLANANLVSLTGSHT